MDEPIQGGKFGGVTDVMVAQTKAAQPLSRPVLQPSASKDSCLLPASCPLPRPCVLINAPPGAPRQGNPLPRPASPSRSHPYRPRPQAHCVSMPAQSRRLDTTCPTVSASGSGSLAARTQQVSASAAQQRASLLQKQLQVWCAIIMIAECNSSLFDLFSGSEQRIERIKQVVAYFSPFTIQGHCRMWHLWQQFADTHGFSIYDPPSALLFDFLASRRSKLQQSSAPCVKSLRWIADKAGFSKIAELLASHAAHAFSVPANPQIRREALPLPMSFLVFMERKDVDEMVSPSRDTLQHFPRGGLVLAAVCGSWMMFMMRLLFNVLWPKLPEVAGGRSHRFGMGPLHDVDCCVPFSALPRISYLRMDGPDPTPQAATKTPEVRDSSSSSDESNSDDSDATSSDEDSASVAPPQAAFFLARVSGGALHVAQPTTNTKRAVLFEGTFVAAACGAILEPILSNVQVFSSIPDDVRFCRCAACATVFKLL